MLFKFFSLLIFSVGQEALISFIIKKIVLPLTRAVIYLTLSASTTEPVVM